MFTDVLPPIFIETILDFTHIEKTFFWGFLMKKFVILALVLLLVGVFVVSSLTDDESTVSNPDNNEPTVSYPDIDRRENIPDISKRGPGNDSHPPLLHSKEYEEPVPLPSSINTAGLEDSPFILPDGNTLYFFFTPDASLPAQKQVLDKASGVWVSHREGGSWGEPERVWLQEPGKLAMDGAFCIQDDEMWFSSVREGYAGMNMFTAEKVNGEWTNWEYSGDRLMEEIQIGEVHIHGDNLYFHSDRSGGKGSYDIWVTTRNDNSWSDPINIEAVNTEKVESQPFITPDGNELWFTRKHKGTPGTFRSVKRNGNWSEPELIVSQFAGEPTLDDDGNLYFVHHYYENETMIEADIYVSHKK